ncbi:MAG: hypothetical protein ACLVHS_04645 [Blautia wexlerae]
MGVMPELFLKIFKLTKQGEIKKLRKSSMQQMLLFIRCAAGMEVCMELSKLFFAREKDWKLVE